MQGGLSRAEDSFNVSDSNPECKLYWEAETLNVVRLTIIFLVAEMMDSGGEENEPAQVQSSPSK